MSLDADDAAVLMSVIVTARNMARELKKHPRFGFDNNDKFNTLLAQASEIVTDNAQEVSYP